MSLDAYLNPEFTTPKKLIFFALSLAGIIICNLLIICGTKFAFLFSKGDKDRNTQNEKIQAGVQMFYEMIISATSVMSFACAYVVLNHVYALAVSEGISTGYFKDFINIWENWKDFILLLLILLSCVLNSILDMLIIPLRKIGKDNKATIRMLAMFYAIIVLLCLNVYGDESEYNPVMMYYLGLMVGRFVYFDASFGDFLNALKNVFLKSPLLVLGLALSGGLSYIGFNAGFFLERNYYIVGVFYAHVFLLAAVFILHLSHILQFIFRTDRTVKEDEDEDEDEEDI